jgi:cell division control protein 45
MWNVGGGIAMPARGTQGQEEKENVDPRANGEEVATQEKKREDKWHVQNFWIAYDACEE